MALPPNRPIIGRCAALDLFDQALDELHYAQKVWGDAPAIQATVAWIHHQRGDLRAGINAMKRAYPIPRGRRRRCHILKVLYPVNYWDLIVRYSTERDLDPYLIAALIAQSRPSPPTSSRPPSAYGLMQLLPSTGRQCRTLRLPAASRSGC